MRKTSLYAVVVCGAAALMAGTSAEAATFTDNFNRAALGSDYYTGSSSGPSATLANTDGTHLTVLAPRASNGTSGSPVASGRAMAITSRSDFDFFNDVVRVDLDGIVLGPTTTAANLGGFLTIGQAAESSNYNSYFPSGGGLQDGVGILLMKNASGVYNVLSRRYVNGAGGDYSGSAGEGLTGIPTGVSLAVDAANLAFTLSFEGATFTASGLAAKTYALPSTFQESNFADITAGAAPVYRVAIGAFNVGAVSDTSSFRVDALSVVVPEPVSLGGIAAAGLLLLGRRRRG